MSRPMLLVGLVATGAVLAAAAVLIAAGIVLAAPEPEARRALIPQLPPTETRDPRREVRQALDDYYAAVNSLLGGQDAPMAEIWWRNPEITDLSAFGDRRVGWEDIRRRYDELADRRLGGRMVYGDVLVRVHGNYAYTVCTERADNLQLEGRPIALAGRATHVFYYERGRWRLLHHQSDAAPALREMQEAERK